LILDLKSLSYKFSVQCHSTECSGTRFFTVCVLPADCHSSKCYSAECCGASFFAVSSCTVLLSVTLLIDTHISIVLLNAMVLGIFAVLLLQFMPLLSVVLLNVTHLSGILSHVVAPGFCCLYTLQLTVAHLSVVLLKVMEPVLLLFCGQS